MYNDKITVANKIITDKVLAEIFQKLDEDSKENIRINKKEQLENEKYEYEYQHWTTKNFQGTFSGRFNFYDDTNITVDNYNSFTTIFNNRLQEVKDMRVTYSQLYTIVEGKNNKTITNHIYMNIYEDRMSIDVEISSEDNKMKDIYKFIKEKINTAPTKYTKIIRKKSLIRNKIVMAFGMIPSIVLCTLIMFIPSIREVNDNIYLLYPLSVLLIGYVIGNIIIGSKLDDLYEKLIPEKKYVGYDSNSGKYIYKDDIDRFIDTSEIIIGKNINNIKYRKEIKKLDKKYSNYLPIEAAVLIALSIIIPVITNLIK